MVGPEWELAGREHPEDRGLAAGSRVVVRRKTPTRIANDTPN